MAKTEGVDLNINLDALQTKYNGLKETHAELAEQLAAVREELKPMKDYSLLGLQGPCVGTGG